MYRFAKIVEELLHQRKESRADLARSINVSDAYISKLLNSGRMPPEPAGTDLYDKLARHFGRDKVFFEELALEDRLGKDQIDNLVRVYHARQLLNECHGEHPAIAAFCAELNGLPETRQLRVVELLTRLAALPPGQLAALEALFLTEPKQQPPKKETEQ